MSKLQCALCHKYFEYEELDSELICKNCNVSRETIHSICRCGQGMTKAQAIIFGQCKDCHMDWLQPEIEDFKPISGCLRPI